MITALVKYKISEVSGHPLLDDGFSPKKSKVVEVEKLTELNDMFTYIIDIKIL